MATQHTTLKSLISIVGAAALAVGFVILFGKLDGPGKLCRATPSITTGFLPAPSRWWQHFGPCFM